MYLERYYQPVDTLIFFWIQILLQLIEDVPGFHWGIDWTRSHRCNRIILVLAS
eukprot:jgi/Psemu1/304318/fgenesh1_kg.146_\